VPAANGPEDETAYLLKSETMRRRLMEARNGETGISLEDAISRISELLNKKTVNMPRMNVNEQNQRESE
jgi:hypothetical protein